ncbi:hypothetical protein [Candidatus Amarolinea dominans]|uniref:hypothetical protein n=1 Tax=Candidatus Amarolinea dominans TaxID=3140696 RepID=UPI001D9FC3D4|nr:hypothetical protein [Anaerolineae bacterium]
MPPPEWDDLRRVPDLRCEGSGWRNDAVATRRRLLVHLATIRPGVWHRREDLVAAIRRHDPDFQRSDGIYTTWYIRRSHESTYLLGFEHWDEVEGALLRFLIAGPLHWLGALDIGASGHGETAGEHGPLDTLRVTSQGAAWLAGQPHRVNAPPPAPIRGGRFQRICAPQRGRVRSLSGGALHAVGGQPARFPLSHHADRATPRRGRRRHGRPRAGLPARGHPGACAGQRGAGTGKSRKLK